MGSEYSSGRALSADFPATWRYVPLRLVKKKDGNTTWVNAFAYDAFKREHQEERLGEFAGFDVKGRAFFGKKALAPDDLDLSRDFIPEWSTRNGCAVGIFVAHCQPQLVIIDCDSETSFVGDRNHQRMQTTYGYDQLLKVCEMRGETLPECPVVRGNREGHRYLIFKQNAAAPVPRRRIKPFKMAIDVITQGHQLHWTAGNRELLSGRKLLEDPPELPMWFVNLLKRDTASASIPKMPPGAFDIRAGGDLMKAFLEAVLRPVNGGDGAWNQRLFNAACTLFENGVDWADGLALVMERCEPRTDSDTHSAQLSIASAWRKTTGEAVPE